MTEMHLKKLRDTKKSVKWYGAGIISWDNPQIYSFFITQEKFYYQPAENRFSPMSIRFDDIIDYIIETGNVSKLVPDFIKTTLIYQNRKKFYFYLVPKEGKFKIDLDRIRSHLSEVFEMKKQTERDSKVDQEEIPENGISNSSKTTPGAILLWDFDNVRLSRKDNDKTNKIINFLRKVILSDYGPLISGFCVNQSTYDDEILRLIKKIADKIIPGRAPAGPDQTDITLVAKAKDWLQLYRPQYMIIISGDHIFTELTYDAKDVGTTIVLIHNKQGISLDWLSTGTTIIGYNLEDEIKNIAPIKTAQKSESFFTCSICRKTVKTESGLKAHTKMKHKDEYGCSRYGKNFSSQKSLSDHKNAKKH